MTDIRETMDALTAQIAAAIGIPAPLLMGAAASASYSEVEMRRFYDGHRELMRQIKTRVRMPSLEESARHRVWLEGNMIDGPNEMKVYWRPSRGFARHNRRIKQDRLKTTNQFPTNRGAS